MGIKIIGKVSKFVKYNLSYQTTECSDTYVIL